MEEEIVPGIDSEPEKPEAAGEDWAEFAKKWLDALNYSEKQGENFRKQGHRITQRYRSDQDRNDPARSGTKFNLFWSNVQTLAPATYSRRPKVEVTRRHRDSDPVARVAAMILERALQYEVDRGLNFHQTMQAVVLDRLLPGLGAAWVRYEPVVGIQMAKVPSPDDPLQVVEQPSEYLKDESTPIDYVFWKDFIHSPAQTWADVTWVARIIPFTEDALKKRFEESIKRFGGKIEDVSVTYDPVQSVDKSGDGTMTTQNAEEVPRSLKRALVYEVWDKESLKIVFLAKGYNLPLDVKDDQHDLDEFWPCPKPLLATTTNDELTPVADFVIYQEQLRELDTLTNRISMLESALRVIGVYDSAQDSLKDMLQSGLENRMIPVSAWAAFAEKGGLKGVTDFMPLDQVVMVLEGLYKAREVCKQIAYEITGMSDIIRGASVASETLGAQQIKAKFANLRLVSRQAQVAEFVTMVLQIKAQLMCKHYSPETLIRISSANQLQEVKDHPERVQEAIALLKDDRTRSYRIEVQSESMLELDEVDSQKRRNEFMSTLANFFNSVKNVVAIGPEFMPVALEMLKFAVRGFPVGRTLEGTIEDAIEAVRKRMAQPQQKGPSPEQVKLMIAQLQDQGETLRTLLKEDGDTDREELKASVEIAVNNMQNQMQGIMASMQAFDAQSDRDLTRDATQFKQALQPPQPQGQPQPGQRPPQPGMMPR